MCKRGDFPTGRKVASSGQGGGSSGKGCLGAGSSLLVTASMTLSMVPGNSDTQAFLGSHISIPKGFVNVVLSHYSGRVFFLLFF